MKKAQYRRIIKNSLRLSALTLGATLFLFGLSLTSFVGGTVPEAHAWVSGYDYCDGNEVEVRLRWGSVSGARYYTIYRNYSYLGRTSSRSYTDSSPPPRYVRYEVRARVGYYTTGVGTEYVYVDPDACANNPPDANGDSYGFEEGSGWHTLRVLSNDDDDDGDSLSISRFGGNDQTVRNRGSYLQYYAADGYAGFDNFYYYASDGTDTDRGTVEVAIAEKQPARACEIYLGPGRKTVLGGETVTLSWDSAHTLKNFLEARGSWSGGKPLSGRETIDPPDTSGTYRYGLAAIGEGGSCYDETVVTVPPPNASISVSPSKTAEGDNVSIDYTCRNSRNARLYQNGRYIRFQSRSTTGTLSTNNYQRRVSRDTQFLVRCFNSAGEEDRDSDSVNVVPEPRSQVYSSDSDNRVPYNSVVRVYNRCYDSTRAYLNGHYRAYSGSETTLTAYQDYRITSDTYFWGDCYNSVGGHDRDAMTIEVIMPPTASLSVSPDRVPEGDNVRIDYTCRNSKYAYLYQNNSYIRWQGRSSDGTISTSNYQRPVSEDTTFRLRCRNSVGEDAQDTDSVDTYERIDADNDYYYNRQCGSTYNLNVDGNDSGEGISISSVGRSRYGGSTSNRRSYVRYRAPSNFNGRDYFRYTIRDRYGNTDSAYAYIYVECNQDPNARFTYSTSGLTATFREQASDPDGSISSYSWSFGDGGSSRSANPRHTYRSAGSYTVRLTVTDNDGASDSYSRTVRVEDPNTNPVARNDSETVPGNSGWNRFYVLNNDSDSDGDSISLSGVTNSPSKGRYQLSGNTVLYRPYPGAGGADSLGYRISDGNGGTDTATVSITIENTDPVAENDSEEVWQNSRDNRLDVLSNDSDRNGDGLSVSSITSEPSNGSASISSDGRYIIYTPNNNYPSSGSQGSDSLSYRVSDGNGGTDTATVSITIRVPEDYFIQVSPTQVELSDVDHGTSDAITITVTRLYGFDGDVSLSIDNSSLDPALRSADFNFSDTNLDASETQSTLIINVSNPIPPGSYPITVRAQSSELGERYRTTTLSIEVWVNIEFEEF